MSPYARFNLRRNPFGELSRAERAELAVVDAQQWLSALKHRTNAVQFIGESGNGKTTHLLAIERALPGAVYVYLPEDAPLPAIPAHRPLLIDEAQRLPTRQQRRVFSDGGPLVLGTHVDLSIPLRRHGLAVISIDVAADASLDRLIRILNSRIDASRLTAAPVPRLERQRTLTLQRTFGSNIRAIEQFLYDEFQDAVIKGAPWPPAN